MFMLDKRKYSNKHDWTIFYYETEIKGSPNEIQ